MKKLFTVGLVSLISTLILLFSALSPVMAIDPAYDGLFGVIVAVDQTQYYTDFMPPGWCPPMIKMVLEVFNFTAAPVTFDFTSSKRYDFSIYNSRGTEVWRWSDGQIFLPVLGQVTIQPRDTKIYSFALKFVDRNGNAMPVDLYTLKGELTATDMQLMVPRIMDGRVSFWHKYVY